MIDVHVFGVPEHALRDPRLRVFLETKAQEVATAYTAIVAKRTGKLAASATTQVSIGGHRHDRLVGKVLVGGLAADYGVLHEFGTPVNPMRRAARDLVEALETV